MPEKIKNIVRELLTTHNTRNPFTLAKQNNIEIFFYDLKKLCKAYNSDNLIKLNVLIKNHENKKQIFVNQNLNFQKQILLCTHGLAHILLNHKPNKANIICNSCLNNSNDEQEIEANLFLLRLLFGDEFTAKYLNLNLYQIMSKDDINIDLLQTKLDFF